MSHFKKSTSGHLVRGVSGHLMRESHCDRFTGTQAEVAISLRDCHYPTANCTGTGSLGGATGILLRNGLLDFYGCLNGMCLWSGTLTWQCGHFAEDCSDVFTLTCGTGVDNVFLVYDCWRERWELMYTTTPPFTMPSGPWVGESCDGREYTDECLPAPDGAWYHFRAGTNYIRVNPLP